MEKDRPQAQQRSRKGKKAWRKNVDISDVQEGLEKAREHSRVLGDEFEGDGEFIIDDKGDDRVLKKNPSKKLKSQEILEKTSKVPALQVERNNKKIQGVNKKEVVRLMKISGRVQGTTTSQARVEKDGLTNMKFAEFDVWGTGDKKAEVPEILEKFSSASVTTAKVVPETLKQAPIAIAETNKDIKAGKSYNPSFESWKALLNEEFEKELSNEKRREMLKEHQEKIKNLIHTLKDQETDDESESDENGEDNADNEINKEEESEENHDDKISLSVNKPTQRKIKTKSQRNRERKHKEREELQMKLKELKRQIHELNKLDLYQEEVETKLSNKKTKSAKAPSKLFKYTAVPEQLEIKLSDELSDSLRRLKPEGNLLYDQMRNLQNSGKVEARLPVAKRRKYTPKITEKWTYKDFK